MLFLPIFLFISVFCPDFGRTSGRFELQFERAVNASVCLRHFWPTADSGGHSSQQCSFGFSRVRNERQISMEFTFRWTSAFSLTLGLHDNQHSFGSQAATPSPEWTAHALPSGHVLRWRVQCDRNYYGSDCGTFCRQRADAFGHYLCDDLGFKRCLKGFGGRECQTPLCEGCARGRCVWPGKCVCARGWTGRLCDQCVPHPGCLHGGCEKAFECQCRAKWGGILCDKRLDTCSQRVTCLHGGTCLNEAPDAFRCQCLAGFSGPRCETAVDACAQQPCVNGRCVSESPTDFRCECLAGFDGNRCEKDRNDCQSDPCENGGQCVDLPNAFQCQCARGWTGSRCQHDVDECLGGTVCARATACRNTRGSFECTCERGFEGRLCETEIDDCLNVTCLNGGQCLDLRADFRCACRPPFWGRFCDQIDANTCSSRDGTSVWRLKGSKVCLCDSNARLVCGQNSDVICGPKEAQNRRELRFERKSRDFCPILALVLALSSESRDFCCESVSEETLVVYSPAIQTLERYVTALGGEVVDESGLWGHVTAVVAVVGLAMTLFMWIWRRKSKSERRTEPSVHCIRNDLKSNVARQTSRREKSDSIA